MQMKGLPSHYPSLFCAILFVTSSGAALSQNELEGQAPSLEATNTLTLTYERNRHARRPTSTESLFKNGYFANLELSEGYRFSNSLTAYASATLGAERISFPDERQTEHSEFAELSRFWLQWGDTTQSQLAARFGRQTIANGNSWWWDDELMAARLFGVGSRSQYQALIAKNSAAPRSKSLPDDPENEDIYWLIGSYLYQVGTNTQFGAFFTEKDDRSSHPENGQLLQNSLLDEQDDELRWLGLQWTHKFGNSNNNGLVLDLQAAYMTGTLNRLVLEEDAQAAENATSIVSRQDSISVKAWALDSWLHWVPASDSTNSYSLGYAFGSGTEPDKPAGSGTFQHTGLQSRTTAGQYYGEIFQPELSNLRVATLMWHSKMFTSSPFTLSHHRYYRDSMADDTFESAPGHELSASSDNLGHETSIKFTLDNNAGVATHLTLARLITDNGIEPGNRGAINYIKLEMTADF